MNLVLLNKRIKNSGLSVAEIAEKIGVPSGELRSKFKGNTDFWLSEMVKISDILKLTDEERTEIFFGQP